MTSRELATRILAKDRSATGFFQATADLPQETKLLNVVMSAVVLLDIMDKARSMTEMHRKVSSGMEKLRLAIGEFSDTPSVETPFVSSDASIKKIAKFGRLLSRNILYDPGVELKAERGAALDAGVLSFLLAMMDAELHQAPWDAPMKEIGEQIPGNRLVLDKMARVMSGSEVQDDDEDGDDE